jgi:hypothetical protein
VKRLTNCNYCSQELNLLDVKSEWDTDNRHYKLLICSCGKKNWVKVDYFGSGHEKEWSELESIVQLVVQK